MDVTPISLLQLGTMVRTSLAATMPDSFWVIAEIAEIREHRNGHCYLELIEKDAQSNQVTARMKANIWSYAYRLLKPYFETTTRQQLVPGIKILIKGAVEYQEVFGLSLNIKDIDPTFTLGDIERKRRQIIEQLDAEGVLEMNKETELPLVIQRIAIISSPSAAGYEDFVNQLENNKAGIKYYHKLFAAVMQGEQTEISVIHALERIFAHEGLFDVAVIVRGGGAAADLMSFDSYPLAMNVAQFPLPVLTGIGHERDFTVTDLVAHTHLKTPTAVAEFIIDHNQTYETWLNGAQLEMAEMFEDYFNRQKERFDKNASRLQPAVNRHLERQRNKINRLSDKSIFEISKYTQAQGNRINRILEKLSYTTANRLKHNTLILLHTNANLKKAAGRVIAHQKEKLQQLEYNNKLNDPSHLFRRGYSLSLINGKLIKSTSGVKPGDRLTTRLANGEIISTVNQITS